MKFNGVNHLAMATGDMDKTMLQGAAVAVGSGVGGMAVGSGLL